MNSAPQIFISYSWSTQDIAQKIYDDLRNVGLDVIKDNFEIKYTERISKFMERIRDTDFALLLISDGYLKSKNCLIEVQELLKEKNIWSKVLPIVTDGTQIYKPSDRLKYVLHWENECKLLENQLKGIDPINGIEIQKEVKVMRQIAGSIDEFIKEISDLKHFKPQELFDQKYQPIIDKIGFSDEPKILDLLSIVLLKDRSEREFELERHLINFGPSTYYYSLRAGYYRSLHKNDLAKHYYLKAIELDPLNVEAQNNLGLIFQHKEKDYTNARSCFESAIKAKPDFDIPRLNLGVLIDEHFHDRKGAKTQYEEILKFDPKNAKAHNNLANCIDGETEADLAKIEFHLLKAIEQNPKYSEAFINLGSFYESRRKDIQKSIFYYKKALHSSENSDVKKVAKTLLKRTQSRHNK